MKEPRIAGPRERGHRLSTVVGRYIWGDAVVARTIS